MSRVKLDLPDRFVFRTDIPVRITDLNYGEHLGNDSLLSILHEARVQFLKHFGFSEKDVGGKEIIMADAVLVYKAEIFYGDLMTIEVAVTDLQRHGVDILYKVTVGGKEAARGKTGIVFLDYGTRTISHVPDEFAKMFFGGDRP